MKKIAEFITKRKLWIIIFFGLAAIASGIFVSRVKINYDISKYLSSNSETSLALAITEDEFGLNGNMQVMVSNIDKETSKEIKKDLGNVEYVINVMFDANDDGYYKDNTALYILVIDGDDYSENAKQVSSDIKELLTDYEAYYGGTAIDKQRMQEAITKEMVYIIIAAVSLAIVIMLITSESWLEPLVLFTVSGIAILINMGTNALLPSVSYITNSISACLQLALSIDYSIVLLHTYKKNKESLGNNDAMKKAIVEVVKPVSASGLTTIAGLCALLFMSYRIGFDIGIVLMKSIVISLITAITLLPGILLVFDKIMCKTHKKSLKFSGKVFAKIASKGFKFIVPIGVCLIVCCSVINFNNTYTYSTKTKEDPQIAEAFGNYNQFMVVFKNDNGSYQNQEAFINEIKNYRTKAGNDVFKKYTSYTNTVLENYDLDKIVKNLDVSQENAEMLLVMYNLYDNKDNLKLNFDEAMNYAYYILNNDSDAGSFSNESIKDTLNKMIYIEDILENENTAEELYNSLTSGPLNEFGNNVDLFSIKQVYGMYYYNSIDDNKIRFNDALDFICYLGDNNPKFSQMIDAETLGLLKQLQTGINSKINEANNPMTKTSFQGYMYQTFGTIISDEDAASLYQGYYASLGKEVEDTIPYLDLMNFLVKTGKITDTTAISNIDKANQEYRIVTGKYSYEEFLTVLSNVVYSQTGTLPQITISNNDIQMIYIMYFEQLNAFDTYTLTGSKFANFVKYLYENNEYMKKQISEDVYGKISDMVLLDNNFKDQNLYNYDELCTKIKTMREDMNMSLDAKEINPDLLSGVYVKYDVNHEKKLIKSVIAKDLLDFINSQKDTNELLINKLDENTRSKIDTANESIKTANKLFKGDNYSRLLISMDLPMEGEDTENFVNYLKETSVKYFGEESHIAGEAVSTNDLKESFKIDSIIISIVTIVSILLIVAFTFKSASIPFILVLVIQGACWIAFATNALTGDVFFMSYIISSCILMGATVDYGILLSSNYVNHRKTMDKKEALQESIKATLPTLFTSGLILIVCGFSIYFISSQPTISTVGMLVGKGAIAAILLILFLLPSLLYLLDKLILKTTYNKDSSCTKKQ